jgi:trans-aconitate methyltransferase
MTQTWSPAGYATHAGFVPALGAGILERLAASPGERILDLGCGDGVLTEQIVTRGARVVGVDSSPEMVAAARTRGLDVRVGDARALSYVEEFDAVFSNAALHWVREPDAVLEGVGRALVPGGRFVAEFGGHGCVAAISVALRAVLTHRGLRLEWPWYFPTPAEYQTRLEAHGFAVEFITLFSRPTPLPTGLAGWLRTFGGALLSGCSESERTLIEADVIALVAPSLCDEAGNWTADYTRLQVVARRADRAGLRPAPTFR